MKTINIHLEDAEHEYLSKLKGDQSWKDFFLKNTTEDGKGC